MMIDSAEYSPDGKFLVLPPLYDGQEEKKVPVALIDEIRERGLSKYDLERLLFVRSLTAGSKTRKVAIEDLVGEDLTGKNVGVYFRNYDDSEWMSTAAAIGVEKQAEGGDYRFVFPPEYETCWEGNCSHYDEDGNSNDEEVECFSSDLQGTYFWSRETVLITEKEVTNG